MKKYPLNQILYGAPGVGKTYDTINIALEILGEDFSTQTNEIDTRQAMQKKFKEYVENGQIVFTTFHQSYGYEEFVEGIRPDFDNEELNYKIENGIFKDLCIRASNISQEFNNEDNLFDNTTNIWKISLGAKVRADTHALQDFCFSNNQIRIGWGDTRQINTEPSINSFRKMKIGDLVCVLESRISIKAVGIIKSEVLYDSNFKNGFDALEYQTYREVEWISKKNVDIFNLNKNKNLVQQTVYSLNRFKPKDLFQLIGIDKEILTIENNKEKPYIIIIDEINRGNISKIFGELITLIEPSKRLGNAEELEVVLPYSKESFGVPNNVYIIGTMNTADKSITTLDTALRRRFEFKKIMPNSFLLNSNCDGINLQELLNKMNERIECLIGDEKLIGHSYFMDINSIDELKVVFRNKILPLLEEYFYNDYSQIKSVLNDNGMIKTKNILNTDKFYLSDDFNETDFKKIYED
ncbi:McrB family protein [Campylobacter sp. RM9334]|uniref:McrB family protein n=1 Tax=Campylobacter sp. RM9334 TaxID=2735732 RepID=UPI0030142B35